jgi:hypothetical protein
MPRNISIYRKRPLNKENSIFQILHLIEMNKKKGAPVGIIKMQKQKKKNAKNYTKCPDIKRK